MSVFNVGMVTQYDDPTTIASPVVMSTAEAVKIPYFQGTFWNSLGAPRTAITSGEFEVFSRTDSTRDQEVGTGGWTDVATTSLPVTNAEVLSVGHVLEVGTEKVLVTAVGSTTIDAIRAYAGTTASAHTATDDVKYIGSAINDTDLKNMSSVAETTGSYINYTQTVAEKYNWTKLFDVYKNRRGLPENEVEQLLRVEAMTRLTKTLFYASLNGTKQKGTAGVAPSTAGLFEQLATDSTARPADRMNTDVAGALTEAKVVASLKNAFTYGQPDTIWCSMDNKEILNSFTSTFKTADIVDDLSNTQAGSVVNSYMWEGNVIDFRVDNNIPNDKLAIVTSSSLFKGWVEGDMLREEVEPEASSREYDRSFSGTFGIGVENVGYDHSLLYGITTA